MIGTHNVGNLVHVVFPEWVDPPIVAQRFNGIIDEIAGHLFGG